MNAAEQLDHDEDNRSEFEKTLQDHIDNQSDFDDYKANRPADEDNPHLQNVTEIPAEDLPADEYLAILQKNVSDEMITECFDELERIDSEREELTKAKASALLKLEQYGCHKKGILAAYNRHQSKKKDQDKIDATFARCGKVRGGYQAGLFD